MNDHIPASTPGACTQVFDRCDQDGIHAFITGRGLPTRLHDPDRDNSDFCRSSCFLQPTTVPAALMYWTSIYNIRMQRESLQCMERVRRLGPPGA